MPLLFDLAHFLKYLVDAESMHELLKPDLLLDTAVFGRGEFLEAGCRLNVYLYPAVRD